MIDNFWNLRTVLRWEKSLRNSNNRHLRMRSQTPSVWSIVGTRGLQLRRSIYRFVCEIYLIVAI